MGHIIENTAKPIPVSYLHGFVKSQGQAVIARQDDDTVYTLYATISDEVVVMSNTDTAYDDDDLLIAEANFSLMMSPGGGVIIGPIDNPEDMFNVILYTPTGDTFQDYVDSPERTVNDEYYEVLEHDGVTWCLVCDELEREPAYGLLHKLRKEHPKTRYALRHVVKQHVPE
jgi:hypothetical protein